MLHQTPDRAPGDLPGFEDDHFALLGMPRRFTIDAGQLESAWRELQTKVHPDRYAAGSDAERRIAMQWASRVNEAYRVLRSPLRRARYLCELAGADIQAESNTAMAPAFLMQQIEWREALDAARETGLPAGFEALNAELDAARDGIEREIAAILDDDAPDHAGAVQHVREWMFIERLLEEVDAAQG